MGHKCRKISGIIKYKYKYVYVVELEMINERKHRETSKDASYKTRISRTPSKKIPKMQKKREKKPYKSTNISPEAAFYRLTSPEMNR